MRKQNGNARESALWKMCLLYSSHYSIGSQLTSDFLWETPSPPKLDKKPLTCTMAPCALCLLVTLY